MKPEPQTDHDMLIRLDQKVDNLTEKVGILTDDHERRIRSLERSVWGASGVAAFIGIIGGYLMQYFFH